MTKVMNAENFRPYLDEKTRAISMSQVTFHAGHRFDVESVGKLCAEKGLYFVVDVMQAIGVVPIDAKAMEAQPSSARARTRACSSHKVSASFTGTQR